MAKQKNNSNRIKVNKAQKEAVRIKSNFLIPSAIKSHVINLLEDYPPLFKYQETWFFYFINTILQKQNSYKNKNLDNVPIPLYSKILKKWVSNYNFYLNWLIDRNILTKVPYSSFRNKSYQYYFTAEMMSLLNKENEFEVHEITTSHSKLYLEKSIKDSPVYNANKHLLKWFNEKLSIDFEGAKNYITDLKYYEGDIFDLKSKPLHWHNQIAALHYKIYYATRNKESDFRLHTIFTNFKKMFKPFVTYDGKNLIGFDLKNSQPFFLVYLIDSLHVDNKVINNILYRIYTKKYVNTFMLQNLKEILCRKGFSTEYQKLKSWVLDGEIYEKMADVINPTMHLGSYWQYTYDEGKRCKVVVKQNGKRQLMKSVFFNLLFCSTKTTDRDFHIFKKAYPNIVELIEVFKSENHANFSRVLQNIESECIIDFVTKRIAKDYPHMPLFTIHDSISTTTDFAHILKQSMENYILQFTGNPPKLEEERWLKNEYDKDYTIRVSLFPENYNQSRD